MKFLLSVIAICLVLITAKLYVPDAIADDVNVNGEVDALSTAMHCMGDVTPPPNPKGTWGTTIAVIEIIACASSFTEESIAVTDPLSANSGLPIWLIKAAKDKMEQDSTN